MRFRLLVLCAVLAAALPAASRAAEKTGFQLQADGLFSAPVGSTPSTGGSRMASSFNTASGFSITASMGMTRRFFLAVRAGEFHSATGWNGLQFSDLTVAGNATALSGTGPFRIGHELTTQPVVGLLQYRRALRGGWTAYAEAGGGLIAFKEVLHLDSDAGELFQIAGYQREAAGELGAGLSTRAFGNFELVGGGAYYRAFVGDGAVFQGNDAPAFLAWSLGLRYPRVTH